MMEIKLLHAVKLEVSWRNWSKHCVAIRSQLFKGGWHFPMDKINQHPLDNSKVFDGSTYTTYSNLTTGLRYPTFE